MNDFGNYCKNRIKYGFYRFLFFILVGSIVFFLGEKLNLFESKVYALETTSVYRNASMSTAGFLYTDTSSITGTIKNGSLNTVYANASYGITFFINKGQAIGKVYKIRVNFNDYDYLKNNNHNKVTITNGEDCSVMGFQLLNQGGSNNQAKGVDITYTCLSAGAYTGIQLAYYNEDNSSYDRITTINWRINNVQWEQVDDNQASQIIANASINTQNIINNNNENTNDIINNQNSNTQDIIDNQTQNTQDMIDSQRVCNDFTISKENIVETGKYLNSSGNIATSATGFGITDYYNIGSDTVLKSTNVTQQDNVYFCFYDTNKSLVSCTANNALVENGEVTIPTGASYVRFSINNNSNLPRFYLKSCKDGNQALSDDIKEMPNKFSNMFMNLFIPDANSMKNLIDDLKEWFETKFGILGQGINIIIEFIEKFLELSDNSDVIIDIPNISVPNFENTNVNIIEERQFNWSALLREKQSINTLWQLYLDFMDVIIIMAFINFCIDTLEGILGEQHIEGHSIYESEGESYDLNDKTGELSNHRYWTKRTRRVT